MGVKILLSSSRPLDTPRPNIGTETPISALTCFGLMLYKLKFPAGDVLSRVKDTRNPFPRQSSRPSLAAFTSPHRPAGEKNQSEPIFKGKRGATTLTLKLVAKPGSRALPSKGVVAQPSDALGWSDSIAAWRVCIKHANSYEQTDWWPPNLPAGASIHVVPSASFSHVLHEIQAEQRWAAPGWCLSVEDQ